MAFANFILDPEIGTWLAENILYNVPNEKAMAALPPELIETYPALGISVEELTSQEAIIDLGEFSTAFTDLNTAVLSAN